VYTLDTNAVIYYLKGEQSAVDVLQPILDQDAPIYVSTITELELFSYASLTPEDEARIETALSTVRLVALTSNIARIAGDLRRLYARLATPDSAIAATAMFTSSTLITRNVRDFEPISGLSLLPV
jgi:predicted nucleic acid-binding protein